MADLEPDEEGTVTELDHKRAVVPTEKGLEEKLHQYINARRAKLRLLTAKSNQIEHLMENDDNLMCIEQKELKQYKKLYEEFTDLNESVKLYLKEEEKEADQTYWFEPKASNCQDFMEKTKKWIEETKKHEDLIKAGDSDVTPMDSVSNVSPTKQKSGRSSSRSSSVSSSISSATSARLREEANRAALVAKAAALKERQALALKEAQLKAEKEQLDVETELAACTARLKVYTEYESPRQGGFDAVSNASKNAGLQDDEDQTKHGASSCRLKNQETVHPTKSMGAKPKAYAAHRSNSVPAAAPPHQDTNTKELCRVMERQTDITEMLVKGQQWSRLPQRDIPLFHGDPLEFRSFLKAFDHAIDSRAESDADKLYFLEQYTRGEPRDLVRSCQHMPAHRGYNEALRLLNDRYGNELKIASALMEKAFKWPQIKAEDGKALSTFSLFLLSCRNTMEDVAFMDELDNPTNMRVIISKLPYKLRERWRSFAFETQEQRGGRAKFADLVSFVDRQAKVTLDPLFGDLLDVAAEKKDKGKFETKRRTKTEKKGSSFATNATPVRIEQSNITKTKVETVHPNSAFTKPCLYCDRNHTLEECQKMKESPHKEKIEFLKKTGLCFGCLLKGHVSKDCKKRMTCLVCAQKHPSMLHVGKRGSYQRYGSRGNNEG